MGKVKDYLRALLKREPTSQEVANAKEAKKTTDAPVEIVVMLARARIRGWLGLT